MENKRYTNDFNPPLSPEIREYINIALADGCVEEYKIRVLRKQAEKFGDDPDEVEMIFKAEVARLKTGENDEYEAAGNNIFAHFANAILKYAVFRGRASRSEFWSFVLVSYLLWMLLLIFLVNWQIETSEQFSYKEFIAMFLYPMSMVIPLISIWARRIHDTDKPGWFILIPLYNIILLFSRGTVGKNKYGDTSLMSRKERSAPSGNRVKKLAHNSHGDYNKLSKWETIGATLFAVATTLHEAIIMHWIDSENIEGIVRWLWLLSGAMIIFSRLKRWTIKKRKG
ncbi:MAG: DUF805 domain-containing protein [Prevotella sp.]|uniref:DUF805 domain-containing protein n=1 Tax=Prevotella sp. TaxID=59823 RepID=UPI002A330D48|nr:DUF805 domain-containing protein [Prevotella sp.]MDD7319115.1 DUF805 domain-containing protein [Prevotellaceae bacterium]MDY4019610.1 DUF805 domain-containing protein [Prevotella sp.]